MEKSYLQLNKHTNSPVVVCWIMLFLLMASSLLSCEKSFDKPIILTHNDIEIIFHDVDIIKTALNKWKTDIGKLLPLAKNGTFLTSGHNFEKQLNKIGGDKGIWSNWNGPYIDFKSLQIINYWPRSRLVCLVGVEYHMVNQFKKIKTKSSVELVIDDVDEQQWRIFEIFFDKDQGDTNELQQTGAVMWSPSQLRILLDYDL